MIMTVEKYVFFFGKEIEKIDQDKVYKSDLHKKLTKINPSVKITVNKKKIIIIEYVLYVVHVMSYVYFITLVLPTIKKDSKEKAQ